MAKSNADTTTLKTSGRSPMAAITSRLTWHELLAIPVVAAGVAIYWFRDYLSQLYFTGQHEVLFYLGLGVVPVAIWLAAFTGVLAVRPRLFKHYRVWLASVGVVALTLGLLSFYQTYDGALHLFTLGGYVNLGGEVGDLIAGTVGWQAALRLGVIVAVIVALASPLFAAFAVMALGKGFVYVYVSMIIAAKGIGRMYRKESPPVDGMSANGAEEGLGADSDVSDVHPTYSGLRDLDESDIAASNGGVRIPEPASAFTGSIVSTIPQNSPADDENAPADGDGERGAYFVFRERRGW
ncbi:MAG: hypothetical protein IIB16_09440 [Chloroflexi bacterium]|nr:hypothetical protein [Chloroflexota bacterium]